MMPKDDKFCILSFNCDEKLPNLNRFLELSFYILSRAFYKKCDKKLNLKTPLELCDYFGYVNFAKSK